MPSRRNPGIEPGGVPTEGGLARTATATASRGAGTGRVGTTVARRFPAVCPSVAEARHFLLEQLGGGCDRDFGLLALMLSELATNAVQHARTEFDVGIWVTPDGEGRSVLVRVTDQAPGFPVPQDPPADAPHGRGLRIIESLAAGWGDEMEHDRPGKTVWFTARVGPSGAGRSGAGGNRVIE
jgi:anti-sigma regulatory factor (Ser/Thr protein kinase)